MEEECRGGKGEKLSPRRSTGSEAKGEADTRVVVSAVTPQPEGGASLLLGSGLSPAVVVWVDAEGDRGPDDAGRDAVVLLVSGPVAAGGGRVRAWTRRS